MCEIVYINSEHPLYEVNFGKFAIDKLLALVVYTNEFVQEFDGANTRAYSNRCLSGVCVSEALFEV
jgi:hypothetical protein